jgi:two-component system, OmpR family, sensor histidine kinase MprB
MTLRVRLGLAAGIAVALAVLAVTISAYAGTKSVLRGQLDNSLRSLSHQISGPAGRFGRAIPDGGGGPPGSGTSSLPQRDGLGISAPGGGEPLGVGDEGLALDRRGPGFGGPSGIVTLIYRSGGTFVPSGQGDRIPVTAAMKSVATRGQGQLFTEAHVNGTHLRVLVQGIGTRGALAVALPMTEVDHTLSSQLLLLLVIAAAGIALAALLAILVARTALAPIARFTRQTETIAANPERLERERLIVSGDDELARLGRTFNTTLDALERSVQSQRNLVADASHELRTPIASVRANLQLLRDEALLSAEDRAALRRDMLDELDELTALVADVVELARGSKPSVAPGEVRVDSIVLDALERTRRRAPELTVQSRLEPTLVHGEGDRIARAVGNLLDNAAKWSPAGGVIEVALGEGVLTVRDHGPGFDERDLPFVFDRFHRAKAARSKPGSGLGLAIVRQAAESHGGFVQAANAPGGGALLRISFGPQLELGREVPEPVSAT